MDPLVRYKNDPAPLIPGTLLRFRWPSDPHDTEAVRSRVQERGRGLFVLEAPMPAGGTPVKVLAECYYPDELRVHYRREGLDPFREADARMGRLVCVNTLPLRGTTRIGKGHGSFHGYTRLTEGMVLELRRNNRNARAELKRSSVGSYRKLELRDALDADDEEVYDEWSEAYAQAYIEGGTYAVNPEHGGRIWRHNVIHRR